ncbi:MAG: hemolysin family protein [Planctomycetota bacterium]
MTATVWFLIAVGAALSAGVLATLHHTLRHAHRTAGEDWLRTIPSDKQRDDLRHLLDDADAFAAALALPRIASSLIVPIALAMDFAIALDSRLVPNEDGTLPIGSWLAPLLGVGLGAIVLWLANVALPAGIARHAWSPTLRTMAPVIRVLVIPLAPMLITYHFVDEVVRRLAGADAEARRGEAEILSAVEQAERSGGVDPTERDMIEAVVEFRSTAVDEIMTPRTTIEALEYTDDLEAVKRYVRDSHHSRIPVYRGNLDEIAGFLYAKDLLKWLAEPGNDDAGHFTLQNILREALFIPETKTVRELLREMIAERVHIAMVADEYGGTAGLVTIEDIVEEVFGEIHDEYEDTPEDEPEVLVHAEHRAADIDAQMRIDDANDALRPLAVELPEDEDFDTVGGYVSTRLGRIPDIGDVWAENGLRLVVTSAEQTRVRRVRLEVVDLNGDPGEPETVAERDDAEARDPDA